MTKKWYIKEFSKLTNVSTRTLHHYDHIGLLIPSERLENGYRKYSEEDLLKLQQILALKSFGIKLSQIKEIINKNLNLETQLDQQINFLEEKVSLLTNLKNILQQAAKEYDHNKSINWSRIVKLIEVYDMTTELENKWVRKVLNSDDLQQYIEFENELKENRPNTKIAFEKRWADICDTIKSHLNDDPNSDIGINIGERVHYAIYNLYGKKYAGLKKKVWEKGFMTGANSGEHGLSDDMVKWLDLAMGAYWQNRIRNIFKKIDSQDDDILIEELSAALSEMYGNETHLKHDLFEVILKLENVPEKSKNWLKKYRDSLV